MGLNTGHVLLGRYRVDGVLGQGGMGVVYQAWDLRLELRVAVKEMVPQAGLEADMLKQLRRQFRREAQTLAHLDHPHLVRVTDFFSEGGAEYLVMSFVQGDNLVDLIAREGALPESQILNLATQLLDALAYCHSKGVIHRDIKPQNVIVHPDGRAVLVDFGLVKLWNPDDERTKTAIRGLGTPEYAPPEQYGAHIGHTDEKSDIYSLGATLYHALTAKRPPTVTQRMADPGLLQPIRAIEPRVSVRTERAVLKAIEIARDQRWPTAQAMADAMQASGPAFLRTDRHRTIPIGREKTAVLNGVPFEIARRVRHWPTWIWGVAGVLAILAVAAWLMTGLGDGGTATATPTITALIAGATNTRQAVTPTPLPSTTPTHQATNTSTPPASTPTATSTPARQATVAPTPTTVPTATATQPAVSRPISTATATATATATSTATTTVTATATSTPTQPPTSTPTQTATSTPTKAVNGTATPTRRWLSAPRLLRPPDGTSFTGWNAEVILEWSSVAGKFEKEYYVLRIPYDAQNVAEFWRAETWFKVPSNYSLSTVGFIDRHYNWSVQVMRCTGNCDKITDDNVPKQGYAVGSKSADGLFYWHPDIPGGGGGTPGSGPTYTPPTNTPPPP